MPLTPAAWKHLLHLCDEAKKQLLSARETGAQSAAGSSNLHIGCSSVGIVALAGRAGGCTTETATATAKTIVNEKITIPTTSNEIDKIVIFYKNGTFKDYKPLE